MPHAIVSSKEDAVSAERIPPPGPLAIGPLDSKFGERAGKNFINALQKVDQLTVQKGVEQIDDETRALIWIDSSANGVDPLDQLLQKHKNIGWIQLPMAGITAYLPIVRKHSDRLWTSSKGAYSQPVAEHALMLTLALQRYIPMRLHATQWGPIKEGTLFNKNVLILGAGGITLSLLSLLAPFTPSVTVLRRRADPIDPAYVPDALKDKIKVDTLKQIDQHLSDADVVVVNCALTPETKHTLAKPQFDKMKSSAVLVNVARGEVIHTDDLVDALKEGKIFGAGLDVTHPEPLPADHPLWNLTSSHPEVSDIPAEQGGQRANVIITPHVANTEVSAEPLFQQRFLHNVDAWVQKTGHFEGVVDPAAGY